MKFIKYTKLEKTTDGFAPKLHEAQFESDNQVITAIYDGSQVTFKEDLRPSTGKEEIDIATKLINDWNAKSILLGNTKANFEAIGVDPQEYIKK